LIEAKEAHRYYSEPQRRIKKMAKAQDVKKDVKKKAQKSLKEKRAEKKSKKGKA
jgi:hypothetical protein